MERKKYSPQSILKIAFGIAFGVWLMMCAPTGWIYDLWAGTGTGQGQTPDSSVSVVHTQADVEDCIRRWVTPERCGLAVVRPGEAE